MCIDNIDYPYYKTIDLNLIGSCNLKCPLCILQESNVEKNILPLSEWISIIDKFTNLKKVILMGNSSEPTLYPYFIELCKELKSRKLQIVISTNGCTRDHTFWDSLSKILDNHDSVIFSVDGISQQEYSTYRINGNLNTLLKNHKSFKNKNKNDYMQFIKFDYNINTIDTPEYKDFVKQFSNNYEIDTLSYNDMFNPHKKLLLKYKIIDIFKDKIIKEQQAGDIKCTYLVEKNIYINQFGEMLPCCFFKKQPWDYEKIKKFEFDDCSVCHRSIKTKLKMLGLNENHFTK